MTTISYIYIYDNNIDNTFSFCSGATPFATVSSRISQHFKRAAEHNPPRAPLLAKHVDQNHSRKINYSLATGENAAASAADSSSSSSTTEPHDENKNNTAANINSVNEPKFIEDPSRTNSKTRRPTTCLSPQQQQKVSRKAQEVEDEEEDEEEEEEEEEDSDLDEEEEEEESAVFHQSKKHKSEHLLPAPPISPSIHPIQQEPRPSTIEGYNQTQQQQQDDHSDEQEKDSNGNASEDESDGEHSDYHEEMLQGDQDLDISAARRLSRRQSTAMSNKTKSNINKIINAINNHATTPNLTFQHPHESLPTAPTSPPKDVRITPEPTITEIAPTTPPIETKPITQQTLQLPQSSSTTTVSNIRKPSFSFSSGYPGDQELWTPFSFEHDFDNVFLQDASTAHHIPFNIATPESVSVSELDNYFSSTSSPTASSSSSNRSQRKSFSSAMLGPNDKSLLQKVLLASAARGVADKIDEEDEEDDSTRQDKSKEKEKIIAEEPSIKSSFSSSSLMNVDNGEDFVKFEDDEKKESPTLTPTPLKKVAEILPAATNNNALTPTTSNTTLSAAEILKSMNIQNLNLSALHQMTSNIPSLQHLSPTFDLAKTMAAYMQSLAKSANANASSSTSTTNSPHAMDLKSILTRFPALEAFIKKDPAVITPPPPTPQPPPLVSATTDFVPNLISAAEPIVHTLTPMTPPMYITLIDHIAVCIVVLAKTETTPEYRIMRRVDTGFINGTVLLTAGGIETESERSMILSFEMERVRMPKKKSQLFGTWIPLRRAQELAVTCSIQHKLGHFLEDSIESYFPNPLPIQVNTRKPHRDSRLTALALAALRSDNSKSNGFIVPPISRQSSSSGSMGAAQLQELLLTHPNKALKSNGLAKAPLLGRYDDQEQKPAPASTTPSIANSTNSSTSGKDESDVDIVNSSDSSVAATSSNEEESESEEVDTTNDLEEMMNRVSNKQPLHIHPRDLQKKRRRSIKPEEEPESKLPKIVRKKSSLTSSTTTGGGKWSSGNNSSTSVGKSTTVASATSSTKKSSTIIIKKSMTGGGKKMTVKKEEEEIDNVVVEHKPTVETSIKPETPLKLETPSPEPIKEEPEEEEHADEDDEDEDIDIGGSDFDDDLR